MTTTRRRTKRTCLIVLLILAQLTLSSCAVVMRSSPGDGGVEPDGDSIDPGLSADGHHVAYWSFASGLVAGDTNGTPDVFLWDINQATTNPLSRISMRPDGTQGNGRSLLATISD